jgi:nitrogen fixation NifU-like protein
MKLDYSPQVMDHFEHPRNFGELKKHNGSALIGNPACGDMIKIYVEIASNRIHDISFQTLGCVAAVAASSALTTLAKGKSIADARAITNRDIANYLGGLPKQKLACSNFASDALRAALDNYLQKH